MPPRAAEDRLHRPAGEEAAESGSRARAAIEWLVFDPGRNQSLVDWWSLTHVAWGFALAMVLPPVAAFAIMAAWEPFEVFVLSPLLARVGVRFGYESLRNSLLDIFFDGIGVAIAAFLVRPYWDPFAGLI